MTIVIGEHPPRELETMLATAYPHLGLAERRWLPPGGTLPGLTLLKLNAVPILIRDQLCRRSRETNRNEAELTIEILQDRSILIPPPDDPTFFQQLSRIRRLASMSGGPRVRTQPLLLPDTPMETVRNLKSLATRSGITLDDLACYLLHQGCRRAYWSRRRRASFREVPRVTTLPRRSEIFPPFGLTPCLLEAAEQTVENPTTPSFNLILSHTPRAVIGFLEEQAERVHQSTGRLAVEILESVLRERTLNPDRVRRDLLRFRCWLTTIDPFDLCPLQIVHFPRSTLRKLLALARRHDTSVQEMVGCHLWLRTQQPWQPKVLM